jgi:hypothetical protein
VLNPDPTLNTEGQYIGKSNKDVVVETACSLQLVGLSHGLVNALEEVVVVIHYVLTTSNYIISSTPNHLTTLPTQPCR